jgi:hypothetical protein
VAENVSLCGQKCIPFLPVLSYRNAAMNDADLNTLLNRAVSLGSCRAEAVQGDVMERVRCDDGRRRRWWSFVGWLLLLGTLSGICTAWAVGWLRASQDQTHAQPPKLQLIEGGLAR